MGILVADRKFFGEIGSLDGGMKIYGGENVELSIRVRPFFFLTMRLHENSKMNCLQSKCERSF